jgi:hypothetical protein
MAKTRAHLRRENAESHPSAVIARSQRVPPSAGPMINSATKQSMPPLAAPWIGSRSLSSGAHSRDPLDRNDGVAMIHFH